MPLVIAGAKTAKRLLKYLQKLLRHANKNFVFLSAVESNYKEVGAAVGMAYGNIVAAESSVDLNLAKQLNILINQWESA